MDTPNHSAADDDRSANGPAGGLPPTAEPAASESSPAAAAPIADVWSRTAPKYRIRAAVFLSASYLLFCGLCVFTFWLRSARPFDFSIASYAAPYRFWGDHTQSLNDYLRFPISVEETPVHGVVLGLLFASICSMPICVAILYRFPTALPFLAAVLLLAHLPWMSVTLLIGCALASLRPFRMKFRFGSALVGLLPVLCYLYLATWDSSGASDLAASPTQYSLIIAPWVLALLSACAMMGVVLLIARLVNYRPGAITPVMAVTFAAPVILFHRYIGVDELAYRVLEAEYGPRSARFEQGRDQRDVIRRMINQWSTPGDELPSDDELLAVWSGRMESLHERVLQRTLRAFFEERAEASDACRLFLDDQIRSRYVPNVLYIQARALDTRIDERRLLENARRELYFDFPSASSRQVWQTLLTRFPRARGSVAAGVRLAQLALRDADVDQAEALLAPLCGRSLRPAVPPPTSQTAESIWRSPDPERTLDFDPQPYFFEAERLRELIRANRDDPRFGNQPLAELLKLDRRRPGYPDRLLELAGRYADGLLHDNLLTQWSIAQREPARRHAMLSACAARFPDGDALPEILFALADLEIQILAEHEPARRAAGIERLRAIAGTYGSTIWGRAAAERLRILQPEAAEVAGIR
ncbi:MAG: hypothetical protein CHACPFDD_00381 [Phycisphaerae bacterium]|nr:hypothetical protein [Phycisphaerae bacterium]